MRRLPNLGESDSIELKRALEEVSKTIGREGDLSLERLIDRWSSFVRDVEDGYAFSIYDYTNDLSVRDILDSLASRVPESIKIQIANELKEADDRFTRATRQVSASILNGVSSALGDRWVRIPKKLMEELRSDLESDGIL
jgi:hypothetical protein